jgi:hypothetical protein
MLYSLLIILNLINYNLVRTKFFSGWYFVFLLVISPLMKYLRLLSVPFYRPNQGAERLLVW